MKPTAFRLSLALALTLCAGLVVAQRPEPEPAPPAVEHPIDQAAAYLRELETRLLRVEARMGAMDKRMTRLAEWIRDGVEPTPEPGPEPTRPTPEPTRPPPPEPEPTRPPPIVQALAASWSIVLQNGARVTGTATGADGALDAQVGPFRLTVIWDDFDGPGAAMQPTPTVFLKNCQPDRGVLRWQSGSINAGGFQLDMGAKGAMPPRYALVRSALTLDHWRLLPERVAMPAWVREQALKEIAASKAAWIGPYQASATLKKAAPRFWVTDRDHQAPGGRAIGPYHGGVRDWLAVCEEGRAYRWAEAIDGASRGVWLAFEDGSPWMPGPAGKRYWWSASSTAEYGPPEYTWTADLSGWCAYETALADEGITNIDHGSRFYAGAFALARECRAAAHIARECTLEVLRAYTMDQRVPPTSLATTDDDGYAPLYQTLALPTRPNLERRDAHAIRIVAEAAACGLLTAEERATYLPALMLLAKKADDGRGVLDKTFRGDVEYSGLSAPACMFFQQALIADALRFLGEQPEAREAKAIGDRIAKWWTARPPYYAHTGGSYRSAIEAPHKGAIGHDYALFTWPGTWFGFDGADYKSWSGVLARERGQPFDETLLDYVPPSARGVWN